MHSLQNGVFFDFFSEVKCKKELSMSASAHHLSFNKILKDPPIHAQCQDIYHYMISLN